MRVYTALESKKRNKSALMDVLGRVNEVSKASRNGPDQRPMQVEAPQSYDGIGQALRSAYRNDRNAPDPLANVLRRLDTID